MYFGKNLQYLRRQNGNMTQEKLAERMGVSRQTVSKWEAGDSIPEPGKLIELCELFSCTLDSLLRDDMNARNSIYLPIRVERILPFRYASYTVISKMPEDDAEASLKTWAAGCGLNTLSPAYIGWDFPYISQEQKHRFGFHGYTSAVILPEGFDTDLPGADILSQPEADYAVMTILEPFVQPFDRIPRAYGLILEYLRSGSFRKVHHHGVIPCFERVHQKDGITCMDVYIHCASSETPEITTSFS